MKKIVLSGVIIIFCAFVVVPIGFIVLWTLLALLWQPENGSGFLALAPVLVIVPVLFAAFISGKLLKRVHPEGTPKRYILLGMFAVIVIYGINFMSTLNQLKTTSQKTGQSIVDTKKNTFIYLKYTDNTLKKTSENSYELTVNVEAKSDTNKVFVLDSYLLYSDNGIKYLVAKNIQQHVTPEPGKIKSLTFKFPFTDITGSQHFKLDVRAKLLDPGIQESVTKEFVKNLSVNVGNFGMIGTVLRDEQNNVDHLEIPLGRFELP